MAKEGNFLGVGDISNLRQLVESLEEAGLKLEEAHKKKKYRDFDKSKRLILQILKKISEVIE